MALSRIRPGDDPAALAEAAALLRAGRLVAFPTETVYGLGADGLNPEAVAGIYAAKGRPATNPLILHVPGVAEAKALVTEWPPEAEALAARFWPGPLTLVLPAAACVPDIVRAGNPTVALRCPDHPVALALLRACGRPLAAPSANRTLGISPTRAEHVAASLEDRVDLILDGGPTEAGLESTILSLATRPYRLLRPGPIPPSELEVLVGPLAVWTGAVADGETQAAPGMARKHYSPTTPLALVSRAALVPSSGTVLVAFGSLPEGVPGRVLPLNPEAAGAALYALLHDLDGEGWKRILMETPPEGEGWMAFRDRITRAATE